MTQTNDLKPMFRDELGFLSNFDETPFEMPLLAGGGTVASGEHAFNALKTIDPVERARVLGEATPGGAKREGRRVSLRPGWNTGGRVRAMQQVLVAKFALPDLAARLEATGDLELVETDHWHDQFWGSCFCPAHAGTPGRNMFGELLMAIRDHRR
ncbi:NADAR family protein [Kitasatospora sp. NPDC088556]|uniref:NADAR family protein n=1 Tax=Kitasatospora sp. NPDC088556 TaxID=3364076 RepID=UPI00380AB450